MLWRIIFEEPGLSAATTADKLDIDGVEEGAPAMQTRESIHEGTYLLKLVAAAVPSFPLPPASIERQRVFCKTLNLQLNTL